MNSLAVTFLGASDDPEGDCSWKVLSDMQRGGGSENTVRVRDAMAGIAMSVGNMLSSEEFREVGQSYPVRGKSPGRQRAQAW
jgi:hypothetical protein